MKHAAECRLHFRADGAIDVVGPLTRGGRLTVDYALERLPNLTRFRHQLAVRKVDAFIKFLPGDKVTELSLLDPIYSKDYTPVVVGYRPRTIAVAVPADATAVELWFRTRDEFPEGSEHWDSRFGQNYVFRVESE